jgi:Tol biopolymer transport system component
MMHSYRRSTTLFALLSLIAISNAGCGSHSSLGSSEAHLLIAYPAGLTEIGLDGRTLGVVVPATNDAVPASPAISPSGRFIAYLEVPSSTASDGGADLWTADRNGTHARRLVVHPQSNHSIRAPVWEDDRHLLVVVDRPSTCDGCNPVTTSQQTLERVDLQSGDLTLVRSGVTAFDLSPDGGSITYPDTSSESAARLLISNMAGGTPQEIVPLATHFVEITSMRFSPDGGRIAFAAADGRLARADAALVSRAAGAGPSPNVDGLPENLWIVDASGQNLRPVVPLREDQPALVWSPDGTALYVIGTGALYRVAITSGAAVRIGSGAVRSQLAYVPATVAP